MKDWPIFFVPETASDRYHVGQILHTVRGFWSSQYEDTQFWEVCQQEWYVLSVSDRTKDMVLVPSRDRSPIPGADQMYTTVDSGEHFYTNWAQLDAATALLRATPLTKK